MNENNQLDISKIFADPTQPRQYFNKEELAELKESIKAKSIYVPLTVESNYNGDNYLLLDGERRYRCAKELQLKTVPVTIVQGPLTFEERTILRFHIQEQHRNWTVFDKAKAIYDLKVQTGMSLSELAKELNTNVPTIHHWLSMIDFSPEGQKEILEKNISFTYLIHLSKIVKDYLSISDLQQYDIEHKLFLKIDKQIFKTTLELQQFSRLMSTNKNIQEKISFLNTPEMSFSDLLDKTDLDKTINLESFYKQLTSINRSVSTIKAKKHSLSDEYVSMLKVTSGKIDELLKEYENLHTIKR